MSFQAMIGGHIDPAVHDAVTLEHELVAELEAVIKKFSAHISGAWFSGTHVSSTNLLDPLAKVNLSLPTDPTTGAPTTGVVPETDTPPTGGATPPDVDLSGGQRDITIAVPEEPEPEPEPELNVDQDDIGPS